MWDRLNNLDRRWIFLAMAIAVAIPVLSRQILPEAPTRETRLVFDAVEKLEPGSKVLFALDYDNASAAELDPMTVTILRHCLIRKHKLYFLTLWPTGKPMVDQAITGLIEGEFAHLKYRYGEDYVNLGYQVGYEVAIKQLATDLRRQTDRDAKGTSLDDLPMMRQMKTVRDSDLLVNISAGYPGAKEWVQFAGTQGELRLAIGCTGVQAPLMYPYIPNQVLGLLAAIKGAAEYEAALAQRYPQEAGVEKAVALKRMAPQLWAHLLMVGLIVLGNVIHFNARRRRNPS